MIATDKRIPWNSETARLANAKSQEAKRLNRLLDGESSGDNGGRSIPDPTLKINGHCLPIPTVIALMRRAQRRYLQWSIASTDVHEACALVYATVEVFNLEQRLLGKDPLKESKASKRAKASLSPHDLPMPDPVSCGVAPTLPSDASGSGVCDVDTSGPQSASGRATVTPVDDTPF